MKHMSQIIFVLFCVLYLSVVVSAQDAPEVGMKAPEIGISDWIKGETDLKGKTIFLEFFESWCGNARAQVPKVNKLYEKFGSDDFVFLYLSAQNKDWLEGYLAKYEVKNPVARDKTNKIFEAFGITGVPTVFLIDKEGKIAWKGHPMGLKDEHFEEYFKTGKFPQVSLNGPM
ncbi:TlpA family protein disulfide reductase [candidate division KSB1 bacterium]